MDCSSNHTHLEWSWAPTLVKQFPGKAHRPRNGMKNPPHYGLVSSVRICRGRQGKALPLTQPYYPGSDRSTVPGCHVHDMHPHRPWRRGGLGVSGHLLGCCSHSSPENSTRHLLRQHPAPQWTLRGIMVGDFCCKFTIDSENYRILKIGWQLAKSRARGWCIVFLFTVYYM